MLTENVNMSKRGSEEAVEPEIKLTCQHLLDYGENKGAPEKTSISASSTTLKPLTVWITTVKIQEAGVSDHLTCLLRNLYASQEATVGTRHRRVD